MDYQKIVKGILDIGEALLKSGAENFRLEDSLYRMCRAYGFEHSDVFAIPSNIQITVETKDGEFITQIRHIETIEMNLDLIDKLNSLSRYVCNNTPDYDEMHAKFKEVMSSPKQAPIWRYLAGIVSGSCFAVFFGCNYIDAIVAAFVSFMIIFAGKKLSKHENNLLIYNTVLACMSELIILFVLMAGAPIHPEKIMIGIVMLLISAMSTTNGIRELLQRDFISGSINIMNSFLGAAGIAIGIALAMLILSYDEPVDGTTLVNGAVAQLISCTIGCVGFAVLFKVRGVKVFYSGIGAFFTWLIYMVVNNFVHSNFFSTLAGATFVALYAFIMSRISKAPSTIYLTASVFPLIPGAALYYLMYGFVSQDYDMVLHQMSTLFSTCIGIAFGFLIIDVVTRIAMHLLELDYHIGKNSIFIK